MSKRLQEELGAMLEAYEVVRRADEQRQRRAESEGLAFLAGFAEVRRRTVRPVFEAAGAMLKARGHDFAIHEEEFVFGADGRASEAAIRLAITPAGMASAAPADATRRELAFATLHYNRTVCITNGAVPQAGSASGAAGGYTLAQIDTQLVEDHVLKLVAALVRT
jgi:hypothetical protein